MNIIKYKATPTRHTYVGCGTPTRHTYVGCVWWVCMMGVALWACVVGVALCTSGRGCCLVGTCA